MFTLVPAESGAHQADAIQLYYEYAAFLGDDAPAADMAAELADFPGCYGPPSGRFYLAYDGAEAAGCVGLRDLGDGVCEMKRLFVRPAYRGWRLGRLLAETIIQAAREAGYSRMRLDTMPSMGAAIALYRDLGFRTIPAYHDRGTSCCLFFELELG